MIQASFRLVAPMGKRQEFRDVLLHVKGPTEALAECRGSSSSPSTKSVDVTVSDAVTLDMLALG